MILKPLRVRPLFFLICFILGLDSTLDAQSHSCSFDSDYSADLRSDGAFRSADELYEEAYQAFIRSGAYESYHDSTFLDLPIVFHIVHQGDFLGSVANPRDETIKEVIDLTNSYFRQTNANSEFLNPNYGADTQISFCLAARDEYGNPASGIIRYYNSPDSPLLIQNKLWNKSLYVNVVVIDRSTCGSYSPNLDVVYIWNKCFQNSSNLTHELGHYLSLKHTFNGEGICDNFDCLSSGDYVCDTPPQLSSAPVTQDGYVDMPCLFPGNSCETDGDDESVYNPYRSMDLGGKGDQPDANNNIMGYAGQCKTDFSIGQKHRMKFNLLEQRSSIWNQASHCENPFVSYNDAGIDRIEIESLDECNDFADIRFLLLNLGQFDLSSAHIYLYQNELLIDSLLWEGSIAPDKSTQLIFENIDLLLGENKLRIESKLPNGSLDDNPNTDVYYFTFFHNIANFSLLDEHYVLYGDEDSLWIGIDTIHSADELNYFWRRNNGPIDSNQQNQPRIFISDPGTYYLHMFGDKYTCELGIFEFNVKQNETHSAKPIVNNNHGQITCGSPFSRLSYYNTDSSDSVIWEANPGLINEDFLRLADLITDVAGDYRVKVTNERGDIRYSDWYTLLDLRDTIPITLQANGAVTCENQTVLIEADLGALTSNHMFTWRIIGEEKTILKEGNDPTLTVVEPGLYELEIADRNKLLDCKSRSRIYVDGSDQLPVAEIEVPDNYLSLHDESVRLNATLSSSDQEYEYMWSTDTGEIISGINSLTPLIKGFGKYTLTIKNVHSSCVIEKTLDLNPLIKIEFSEHNCHFASLGQGQIPLILYAYDRFGKPVELLWSLPDGDSILSSAIYVGNSGFYNAELVLGNDLIYSQMLSVSQSMLQMPKARILEFNNQGCVGEDISLSSLFSDF